jgi:hypothetical protein
MDSLTVLRSQNAAFKLFLSGCHRFKRRTILVYLGLFCLTRSLVLSKKLVTT